MNETIELSVLDPAAQTELCDDLDLGRGDRKYALTMLGLIGSTRQEIKQGGIACLGCSRHVTTTVAVSYAFGIAGSRAERGVFCEACTASLSRRDLCLAASHSLANHLIGKLAIRRCAYTLVHTEGGNT